MELAPNVGRAAVLRAPWAGAGGLSGCLSKGSRFSAEKPDTWPAQICSMRTRRCAVVARKLSTFREKQRAIRGGWDAGTPYGHLMFVTHLSRQLPTLFFKPTDTQRL